MSLGINGRTNDQVILVGQRTNCAPRPTASIVDTSETVIGNDTPTERREEAAPVLVVGVLVAQLVSTLGPYS